MEKLKVNLEIQEDEEILSSMKEAYLACAPAVKYCKDIGIPEEKIDYYITKIFDFVCDTNYCKQCPGTKECKKNNPLLVSKIKYKNGVVSSQLVPCKALLKKITFEKQFKVRDFPEEWLDKRLQNIDKSKEKQMVLKRYIAFLTEKYSGWIFINGNIGTGKSFLAAILSVDLAGRVKGPICYLNCVSRFREMSDLSFKKNSEFQEMIDKYSTVPVLVLDDFGNEYKTDFVRDAIIYTILSYRASKRLFTMFTSDFSIDEIETMYSNTKAGEIRARQIANLLRNKCGEEINLGEIKIH